VAHDERVQLRAQSEQGEAILVLRVGWIRQQEAVLVIEDGRGWSKAMPCFRWLARSFASSHSNRSGLIPTAYLQCPYASSPRSVPITLPLSGRGRAADPSRSKRLVRRAANRAPLVVTSAYL
jgi:hypothetical protein